MRLDKKFLGLCTLLTNWQLFLVFANDKSQLKGTVEGQHEALNKLCDIPDLTQAGRGNLTAIE